MKVRIGMHFDYIRLRARIREKLGSDVVLRQGWGSARRLCLCG
ncbi:MAG: hypothetical protein ACLRZN_07550 [Dialister invisus]